MKHTPLGIWASSTPGLVHVQAGEHEALVSVRGIDRALTRCQHSISGMTTLGSVVVDESDLVEIAKVLARQAEAVSA